MADEFTCNKCGTVTDVGYFYCEKCHRIHKRKDEKHNEGNSIMKQEKEGEVSNG
jgi:dynactin complex subunit